MYKLRKMKNAKFTLKATFLLLLQQSVSEWHPRMLLLISSESLTGPSSRRVWLIAASDHVWPYVQTRDPNFKSKTKKPWN